MDDMDHGSDGGGTVVMQHIMAMPMYFETSRSSVLWFKTLSTDKGVPYAVLLIIAFCTAVVAVAFHRVHRACTAWARRTFSTADKRWSARLAVSAVRGGHGTIQLFFHYMLMLAAMTYNMGIFLAVLAGYLAAEIGANFFYPPAHCEEGKAVCESCCQVIV